MSNNQYTLHDIVDYNYKPFYLTIRAMEKFLENEKAKKYERAAYYELKITNQKETFNIEDYGAFWDEFIKILNEMSV